MKSDQTLTQVHKYFILPSFLLTLIKGQTTILSIICSLIFNLKVMIYPWLPTSSFFSLVNLSQAQSTLWNLHVKQTLIGNSKINQIGCHCLTMTRFIPAANFLIMAIKQRTIDLVHTWQYRWKYLISVSIFQCFLSLTNKSNHSVHWEF